MKLQKALELIEHELAHEAPYHPSDFYDAVARFIPLMEAAAQLEKEGLSWDGKRFRQEVTP